MLLFARYGVSLGLAMGITFLLFFAMQYMVTREHGEMKDTKTARVLDFVRLKRDTAVKAKERVMPNRPRAMDQPNAPQLKMAAPGAGAGLGSSLAIKAPTADLDLRMKAMPKLGAAPGGDASETPLVRIHPEYPLRARQDGIEGSVRVRFDVDPRGKVQNVRITSSTPRGVFDRAVLKAVKRWRYRPKVENGVATWRRGLSVRLPFKLRN